MNEDHKFKALHIEFEEILTCIKPLYLNWKVLAEKNLIAAWIRKLTNMKCVTMDSTHLRNLYILAMFDCLRKEILPTPFNVMPPSNELMQLPSHLKEVIEKFSLKPSLNPDWLGDEELIQTKENMYTDRIMGYEEDEGIRNTKFSQDSDDFQQNLFSFGMISQVKLNESSESGTKFGDTSKSNWDNNFGRQLFIKNNIQDFKVHRTDMDIIGDGETYHPVGDFLENYEDIESKPRVNELSFSNRVQEKEMLLNNITGMERRLAQLQNSYHEDIMKLRSQHDIEIQSLINRKNIEMEQIRKDFNEKINEQEYHMDQLETKANECMKQLQLFQENKLKEIDQMKKNHNDNLEEKDRHHEQKVLLLYEDFQKEKIQIIYEKKKREDAITKETQDYFTKVKTEFLEKATKTDFEIKNLEKDIGELKSSKMKITELNEQLTIENQNLMTKVNNTQMELNEIQKRYQFIESQHNRLMLTHDQEVRSIKDTLETALHNMECAKDEIQAQAHDKTSILTKQIEALDKSIFDLKQAHKSEMEIILLNNESDKSRLKQLHDNELEMLKSQLKNNHLDTESKIMELTKKIELKEVECNQIEKELFLKDKISAQMIEDIKQEMSISNERQLRKKQFEFEQIESELKYENCEKSKEVSELMKQLSEHKHETEIKLSEIRKWSDSQISVLTVEWKEEKKSIELKHKSESIKIDEEHKKEILKIKEEKDKKVIELLKEIEMLKNDIGDQKNEFKRAMETSNNHISDLVRLHEEEKAKLELNNQVTIDNLNQQSTDFKSNIEKVHTDQVSQILTKTNEKLREIEQEYGERSLQSFKMNSDLKGIIERLKKDLHDEKKSHDEQLSHLVKKYQSEIENYQKIIKANLEAYKKEIINEQSKYKQLEKLLDRKEYNNKRQLNQLKSEYETKISKLLPFEVKIDFEETIQSLRGQISFLQQRIIILEDEVDTIDIYKSIPNGCFLKQKCDKISEE